MIEITSLSLSKKEDADLSHAFGKGLITLLGPNGSGKTTLMRSILGINSIGHASIRFDGRAIPQDVGEQSKTLAWCPEQLHLAFPYPVLDVVLMGRFPHHLGYPSQNDKDIALETLDAMGIAQLGKKNIRRISSGELRKVMIARCLVQDTPLVLLDEPCANLDLKASEEIMRILKQKSATKTIILTLHDLQLAWQFSDYSWMMKNLAVRHSGPTKQVLSSLTIREIFDIDMEISTNMGPVRLFSKQQ